MGLQRHCRVITNYSVLVIMKYYSFQIVLLLIGHRSSCIIQARHFTVGAFQFPPPWSHHLACCVASINPQHRPRLCHHEVSNLRSSTSFSHQENCLSGGRTSSRRPTPFLFSFSWTVPSERRRALFNLIRHRWPEVSIKVRPIPASEWGKRALPMARSA